MAFYLSPLVDVQEQDFSSIVETASSAIGCIVIQNPVKGREQEKILISDVNKLINTFGQPTNDERNYIDMLTSAYALTQMNKLYCTAIKPEDATYAGIYSKIEIDEETDLEENVFFPLSSDLGDETVKSYNLKSFSSSNIDYFGTEINPEGYIDFIATSRGKWANNIRLTMVGLDVYNKIVRKQDKDAIQEYKFSNLLLNTDLPINSEYDFLMFIQILKDETLDKKDDRNWKTLNVFEMSTLENSLNVNGNSKFVENVILESEDIRCSLNETEKNKPFELNLKDWLYFDGGSEGSIAEDLDSEIISAYKLYSNSEEIDINIFLDGNKSLNVKNSLILLCESRKDCMCILDIPKELVVNNKGKEVVFLSDWRKGINSFNSNGFNENSDKAVVYANWLEVYDQWNKKYRWIPASGFAAASWALTDQQNDPWFAPAGLTRGKIQGVRKLAFNPTQGERDILYMNGLNPIVSFAKEGKVIWGQKTFLDSTSSFNRINIRRLFLVLEKSIATFVRRYLFEPNDNFTRYVISQTIIPFLKDVKARRGITDFLVVCDNTNNSPASIDRGELWCDIMIKPTHATEFIILRFSNSSSGLSFNEILPSTII